MLKSFLENRPLFAVLMFAAWTAGIMSGSVVVILAGLLIYLRPMLYVSLIKEARPAVTAYLDSMTKQTVNRHDSSYRSANLALNTQR